MLKENWACWAGSPSPLGATWDGEGVNFALFSDHAELVELCLYNRLGEEVQRIRLREQTNQVWHCYLPEARPGLLYAYRVYGPYAPKEGNRFNHHKLLLDPYAKSIEGNFQWNDAHFAYVVGDSKKDLSFDRRDNSHVMPKCKVVDSAFTWADDRSPDIPWHDTILYELHVKGFTQLNMQIPSNLRGTYSGLCSAPAIKYLKSLGITAVELLPVHFFIDERETIKRGLSNYWGYNSIGYFSPDMRYSSAGDINEFKTMVKTLHSVGIEVILDVVYNHTAEGNHLGPTFSFRGIDNRSYYRLDPNNPRHYVDYTGCGNTLNMMHPRVLQLIMDSLRYWVLEMHVDGFRFDLASALARELHEVDRLGAFFDIIHQDPIISQVKLIAEPWDLGEGGYQVGNFPVGWTEWNGKYRDTVRAYWKGDGGLIGELGYRLTGSSDLYQHSGRRPFASINFITCHDGFTLRDLVSYNEKHNEANGEKNRDGDDNNNSWNCGAEGDSLDSKINRLRIRQRRNFMATLLLSQGVPMITAGDELGKTQIGNNNAYCQDNEISWIDWQLSSEEQDFLQFVQTVIDIRKNHCVFRRRQFFQGRSIKGKDLTWLRPEGGEMSDDEWNMHYARCLGMLFIGDSLDEYDARGRQMVDSNFLILLNAHHESIKFIIPKKPSQSWKLVFDTYIVEKLDRVPLYSPEETYEIQGRSMVFLVATSNLYT